MARIVNGAAELSGWKQIAGYLRVSIRTAQKLERDEGLPVHRGAGLRGPVYGFPAELDQWRADIEGKRPETAHSPLPQPATRRQWLRYAWGGPATLAAVAMGYSLPRLHVGSGRIPAAYRLEGTNLVVLGQDGSELWRHSFSDQLDKTWLSREPRCVFADLDGDGKLETLFHHVPESPMLDAKRSLACFDSSGRLRWDFIPGKTVVDNHGHDLVPPYTPGPFRIVSASNQKTSRIILTSNSKWSFPDQVAMLDGRTGRVLSEYWHRGHVLCMDLADLDANGEPEVLVGGVNDAPEYKQATLLVFDNRRISGCSRDPSGKPYFQNMTVGTERSILLFPRTPVSRREEFNRVKEVNVASGRIAVCVAEGISELAPSVIYEFDYGLRITNITLSGELQNAYRLLQESGQLPVEPLTAITESLKLSVRRV